MKYFSSLVILLSIIIVSSCAKVYYSPEAENACRDHKIIAVLSPKVSIPPSKNMTSDEHSLMIDQEAESLQQGMVSWLLKRKMQNKISPDILDGTNTILKLNNAKSQGKLLTPKETAEILNVDAVLTSNFKLTKPMSTGAAIFTTVLFGIGTTNQIYVTMELHDRKTNKMIWNFNHTLSGGLFSTSDQLVQEVMRIASKKLPYTKFKKK